MESETRLSFTILNEDCTDIVRSLTVSVTLHLPTFHISNCGVDGVNVPFFETIWIGVVVDSFLDELQDTMLVITKPPNNE
jgi:hypothetical protein